MTPRISVHGDIEYAGLARGVVVYDAAQDEIGVVSTRRFAVLVLDTTGGRFVVNRFVQGAGR